MRLSEQRQKQSTVSECPHLDWGPLALRVLTLRPRPRAELVPALVVLTHAVSCKSGGARHRGRNGHCGSGSTRARAVAGARARRRWLTARSTRVTTPRTHGELVFALAVLTRAARCKSGGARHRGWSGGTRARAAGARVGRGWLTARSTRVTTALAISMKRQAALTRAFDVSR